MAGSRTSAASAWSSGSRADRARTGGGASRTGRRQGRDRDRCRIHARSRRRHGQGHRDHARREGARVLLADIHPERAEETRTIIEGEGGTASVFAGDLTQAADGAAMVRAAVDAYGTVDILVNNIGAAIHGSVVDTSEDDWDRVAHGQPAHHVPRVQVRGAGHGRQGCRRGREHRVDLRVPRRRLRRLLGGQGRCARAHRRHGLLARSPGHSCQRGRARSHHHAAALLGARRDARDRVPPSPRRRVQPPRRRRHRAGTSPPPPCSSRATRPAGSRASPSPSTAACSPRHHC